MSVELMKAVVPCGSSVQIENRPIPEPDYAEVVVHTTAASLCTADPVEVSGGSIPASNASDTSSRQSDGFVIGHEAVGVVHALGAGVTGFQIGDRVVAVSTTPCGQCENCQRGYGGHCQDVPGGGYSPGVTRDGSLAEYFTVPNAVVNLAKVPDEVTDVGAVFVTDSFATGSTAIEDSKLPFGGTVVIFGQGHVGLGATAAAKLSGAGLVITVKSRPGGEDISRAMGADVTLNRTEHDVSSEVIRLTGGVGVDLAVEASGAKSAFEAAFEVVRLGGEISVIATYTGEAGSGLKIPLDHWGWGVGDKNVTTRFQRSGSERTTRLLRLLAQNRVDPTPMFTHEYRFSEATRAFEDIAAGVRGLIKPIIHF